MMKSKKKRIAFAVLNAALLVLALVCFLLVRWLSGLLQSQQEAERWRGESETRYVQVSCFIPEADRLNSAAINEFRSTLMKKLKEASFDIQGEEILFSDAWSTTGKVYLSSDNGHTNAAVIAVGGNFFDFHPIRLISGTYLRQEDLMHDRVLIDEEAAWLLYGGNELQGLPVEINGVPFQIAGVIEREQDFASKKAYTAGLGIYMSYDAYHALVEDSGVSCYELAVAEPVKGFGLNLVKESFPVGQGEVLQNTGRFRFTTLFKLLGKFGTRSMQTLGVIYPYWENAARCVEDWGALLQLLGLLFLILPVVTAVMLLTKLLRRGKERFAEDLFPKWRDRIEEAVRVRQRRHWERTHKGMK